MATLIPDDENVATVDLAPPATLNEIGKFIGTLPQGGKVFCTVGLDGTAWFWDNCQKVRNIRVGTWIRPRIRGILQNPPVGNVVYLSNREFTALKKTISPEELEAAKKPFVAPVASPPKPLTKPVAASSVDDLIASMPVPVTRTPRKTMSETDKKRFGIP